MGVTISIDQIKCVDGEDFTGADDVYYMSMLGCEAEPGDGELPSQVPAASRASLLHATRARVLSMNDGDVAHFRLEDRTLYPNAAIPEHGGECESGASIVGPIYFFDADAMSEEQSPSEQLVTGIVFGHVAGAAAVLIGLMIGGVAGAVSASVLFVGSIIAGSLTLKHILSAIDRDDYLGGYQFSVPVEGAPHEEITFELSGSKDGILADDGRKFEGTVGKVLYELTVRVDRD